MRTETPAFSPSRFASPEPTRPFPLEATEQEHAAARAAGTDQRSRMARATAGVQDAVRNRTQDLARRPMPAVELEAWASEDDVRTLFGVNAQLARDAASWRHRILAVYLALIAWLLAIITWFARAGQSGAVGWLFLSSALLSLITWGWLRRVSDGYRQSVAVCSAIEARWGNDYGSYRHAIEHDAGSTIGLDAVTGILGILGFCLGLAWLV